MLLDDRPQFNLALSLGEGFLLKDGLRLLAYAREGNTEAIASYVAGADVLQSAGEADALAARLEEHMRPIVRAAAAEIRELADRAREERDEG